MEDLNDALRKRFADYGLEELLETLVKSFSVSPEDVVASRKANAINARHTAWAYLREKGWSYAAIGQLFGTDHAAVIRALRRREKT